MTVEGYFGTMAETTSNYSRDFPRRVVGKNRNNSNNKQLSNLKETKMETEEKHTTLSVVTTIRTSLILPIRSKL